MARDEKLANQVGTAEKSASATTTSPFGFKISELPVDTFGGSGGLRSEELDDRNPLQETYFIHVKDKFEEAAAKEWLFANAPGVPYDNLRVTLPLDKLTPRSTVFLLARKGTIMRPVAPAQPVEGRTLEGFLAHKDVPANVLAEQMGAYGPIKVSDYYANRSRLSGGGLNRTGFLDALAAIAHPYGIGWADAPSRADHPPGNEIYLKVV